MIKVDISDEAGEMSSEAVRLIEKVVRQAAALEGYEENAEVSVVVVDNAEIRRLNKEFRGIDDVTDVLSFPMMEFLGDPPAAEREFEQDSLLGDIVFSFEKAREQADEYGHSIEREIGFLVAHSMLHLFGYDHESKQEEREMFAKQEKILGSLGLNR